MITTPWVWTDARKTAQWRKTSHAARLNQWMRVDYKSHLVTYEGLRTRVDYPNLENIISSTVCIP